MVRFFRLALIAVALCACKRACATEPVIFWLPADDKNENSGSIRSVAFSPDGKLVAASFGRFAGMLVKPVPGQALVWNAKTGRHRATLLSHTDGVSAVAFSPDRELMVTTGFPGEIKLWHVEDAKELASIQTRGVAVSVAFSPDGKFFAIGLSTFGTEAEGEPNLVLYDVASRHLVRRLDGGDWGIATVAFSPDGGMIATGGDDGTVRLWDTETGTLIAKLTDQKLNSVLNGYWRAVSKKREVTVGDVPPSIESVAFSPDGQRLAVAGGMITARGRGYGIGAVTIWDVATRKRQSTLPGHDISVKQVQFSIDGKLLATAGRDGYLRLWDADTLRQAGRVSGGAPIAFSPDGKGLISSDCGAVLALRQLVDVPTTKDADEAGKEVVERLPGLEKLWSIGYDTLWPNYDNYLSAVYDTRSNTVFALHYGECDLLGLDGKVRRSFKLDADVNTLRLARLSDTDQSEFIGFQDPWGGSVVAFDSTGEVLWQQATEAAVNDVWVADLDANGRDEVIVGYNGSGGLHVYDHAGMRRWKNVELSNVSHVTAGNVFGNEKKEVIETSTGKVQIFDANGVSQKMFAAPFEPFIVRVLRLANDDPFDTIVIAGSDKTGAAITAMDGNGKLLWTKSGINRFERIDTLVPCPSRPWLAICGGGGDRAVAVVDCRSGNIIADAGDQGSDAQVAWAAGSDGNTPILLVATVRAMSAFRVKISPSNPASEKAK